jgi:uncharacterized protein YbjT (DUF2867 family)
MAATVKAIVLGGSGNVGQKMVSALCTSTDPVYSDITLISRRALPQYDGEAKVSVRVVADLDKVDNEKLEGYDAAFMLMGVGKASQSTKDELLRIDCTIPVAFASACKKGGVKHFSALSSVGADVTAQYSALTRTGAGGGWYLHVKGAMEQAVAQQGFASVTFMRPAGIYPGNSNTPETLGWLNEKLNWALPAKYVTASSEVIAKAMAATMSEQLRGAVTGTKVVDGGQAIRDVAEKTV